MPTGEIGHLRAALSANHAAFENDMKKAKEAVRRNAEGMSGAMERVGRSFGNVMTKLTKFAALATTAAAAAFSAMIYKELQAADRLDELAQATGTTTEFLSSMTIALKTSSMDAEQLAKGIERLSKNMKEIGTESAASKEAFKLLGVEIENTDGTMKDTEGVFKELADKFASLPDGAEKTALALTLFGKAGADMIPILNMGSAGLAEMQAKAESLGLVISTDTAKQAAYLTDQVDILKLSGEGFVRVVAMAIVPYLNEMSSVFLKAAKNGGVLAGALAVVKSTWNELSRRAEILTASKKLEDAIKEYDEFRKKPIQIVSVDTRLRKEIEERKAALNALMAEDAKKEKAEDDAMNASLERLKKEREAREANLKSMLKTQEARTAAETKRKKEDEEEKRRQANIENITDSLEEQAATWGMTSQEVAIYRLEQLGANKAQLDAAQIAADEIRIKELLADAEKEHQKELEKTKAAALKVYEDTRTPSEKFVERMQELDDLLSENAIDYETWARATQKAMDDWDKSTEKTKDGFDELQKAIEGWGQDSARAIVDFAMGAKGSFTDLIDSIIKDIMRMMVYQNITKPLFSLFSGGAADVFSFFRSAEGNVFSGGHLQQFAKGGIFSGPTVFPMATGAGLMGEAGPEAVMPLSRLSTGELGVKTTGDGSEGGNYIYINAVDAKSFEDMCRRNPNAIIGPVTRGLKANQQRKQWRGLING